MKLSLYTPVYANKPQKHFTEAKKLTSLSVTWVTSDYSVTKEVTKRNYQNIEKEVAEEFKNDAGTDDFWVDSVWSEDRNLSRIDWKELVTNKGSRLDLKMLDQVFEDEGFAIKASFLLDRGYDVTDERLEEVSVWEAEWSEMIDSSFGDPVPSKWAWEQLELHRPDLAKALEKGGEAYFELGRWIGDFDPNGWAKWSYKRPYFVYTFNV